MADQVITRDQAVEALKEKLGVGRDKTYAAMGAFATPEELVEAGKKIYGMGYRKLDAMSPFPVHGIDDAIGIPRSKLGWMVVCFAMTGLLTAQALMYYVGVLNYPLVIDANDFIGKLESIKPYIIPKEPRTLEQGEYLQTPAQLEQFLQFSGCINCMLCYAACPQYGLDSNFTGPGILALLHRYNADSRDGARDERMELVHTEEGVWSCTAVGYCSEVCPKGVDPANAVNQNKTASAMDYFLRFVMPKGGAK